MSLNRRTFLQLLTTGPWRAHFRRALRGRWRFRRMYAPERSTMWSTSW